MNTVNILNDDHLRTDPFKVPDGYFDDFALRLMSRLPQAEQTEAVVPTRVVKPGFWQRTRPWAAAAAVVAVIALATHTMKPAEQSLPLATAEMTASADAAESDALLDYLMWGQQNIYDEYEDEK